MTPEERKEYNRLYYQKNKEKERERCKQKYYKDVEKSRENARKYNKKQYYKDIEKSRERSKEYYNKNVEKMIENNKLYCQTPEGIKSKTKKTWKSYGLNMKRFEIIYWLYLSTTKCDLCHCILTKDIYNTSTTKCMDHSHKTGKFRNILCLSCNSKRREDNF